MSLSEKKRVLIGEEEVRVFIRRPACPDCADKGAKRYCEKGKGQVVVGPQEMAMEVWACTHCNYSVPLPPGAYPSQGFQIIHLEGPPGPKDGT
jgi:hypothetical protein